MLCILIFLSGLFWPFCVGLNSLWVYSQKINHIISCHILIRVFQEVETEGINECKKIQDKLLEQGVPVTLDTLTR